MTQTDDSLNIVSLLPAATEICYILDLMDNLVGVSHDCDWPPDVRSLPVLSETVVDEQATSGEIDKTVRERVHNGRSVYHVDADKMRELDPDLILTQELCEVCAPAFDEVEDAARAQTGDTTILSLEPQTLVDILDNISLVARYAECEERGEQVVGNLQKRIDSVRKRSSELKSRPDVLCVEWLDPIFIGGHWVPEMVEVCGGTSMNEPGEHSVEVTPEKIREFSPDCIVLMPCGFSPERIQKELPALISREFWGDLRAVRQDNVYAVHGSHFFNRPGPRIVTGVEIMANVVHPREFQDLEIPEGSLFRVRGEQLDGLSLQ